MSSYGWLLKKKKTTNPYISKYSFDTNPEFRLYLNIIS